MYFLDRMKECDATQNGFVALLVFCINLKMGKKSCAKKCSSVFQLNVKRGEKFLPPAFL